MRMPSGVLGNATDKRIALTANFRVRLSSPLENYLLSTTLAHFKLPARTDWQAGRHFKLNLQH